MRDKEKTVIYSLGVLISLILLYGIAAQSTLAAIIPLVISWLLVILTVESFDRWYFDRSIISRTKGEKLDILFATVIFCIFLDFFGMFVSRLWHYPPGTFSLYLILAPPAYYLYGKLMFVFYETFEKFIEKEVRTGGGKRYGKIMNLEFILGSGLMVSTILYSASKVFSNSFSLLSIDTATEIMFSWWYTPMFLIAFFFIFEYISYTRDKPTLTLQLMKGNYNPLVSSIVATLLSVLFVEVVNAPIGVWRFNPGAWPLSDLSLFQIPLLGYLYWPLQFPALLAMIRAIYPPEESIW